MLLLLLLFFSTRPNPVLVLFVKINQRGESSPLILKSAAVDTLTSEGGTILLGVLLADMTGTMLKLQGVNGGSGTCYYPASFVNDVLA